MSREVSRGQTGKKYPMYQVHLASDAINRTGAFYSAWMSQETHCWASQLRVKSLVPPLGMALSMYQALLHNTSNHGRQSLLHIASLMGGRAHDNANDLPFSG